MKNHKQKLTFEIIQNGETPLMLLSNILKEKMHTEYIFTRV